MDHLIADSGIHFITREMEFNPSEPLVLGNGGTLKYSFVEAIDFLEGFKVFNLLYYPILSPSSKQIYTDRRVAGIRRCRDASSQWSGRTGCLRNGPDGARNQHFALYNLQ